MSSASANEAIRLAPLPEYPEIILALNLLSTMPPLFHWMLFVPEPGATRQAVTVGKKLHAIYITGTGDGEVQSWAYEFVDFTLGTSHTVAAAATMGRLPAGKTVEDLNKLLQDIPMEVPAVDAARETDFTCRVWTREAARRMHAHGYIHCPDVDALEEEMKQYGEDAADRHRQRKFGRAVLVDALSCAV